MTYIKDVRGPTNSICAKDGIDQGEVLSPLIWQIFYDPHLVCIQNNKNLGYSMEVQIPTDIKRNKTITQSIRQAVLAYADDTTWLASSNQQMQITLDTTEEFYKINDININLKKTKLTVFNPRVKRESCEITIAKEMVKAEKKDTLVRFLKIYF